MTTATAYIRNGTLTDSQTVKLSEPLPVTGGEVRVTVEVVPASKAPVPGDAMNFLAVIAQIHEDQRQRGHIPMTKEEIDAYIKGERDSWEDD